MASQTNEAKIIVSAQDNASAELAKVQARFDAMLAPVRRLQAALAQPMHMAGITNVQSKLRGLHGAMQSVPLAGTLFAAGGVAAVTSSLIGNSIAAHDALGKINDLSKAYKVSAKDLQVYGEVGADSGVAVGDIAKSFGFLQTAIAGARNGEKGDLAAMYTVGITAGDLQGDAASVFNKISDVFKKSTAGSDDATKIDVAKKLFGKSGIAMIPMLEEGGAKYAEAFKKMTEEGRIFTDAQVEQADATGDAWGASMRRIDALKKTVGLAMGPMLDAMSEGINALMAGPQRAEIIETFKILGSTIAQEAPKFIKMIPEIVGMLGMFFKGLREIGSLVGWDKLLLGGIVFLASPFIASTITMMTALGRLGLSLAGVAMRVSFFAGAGVMSAINGIRGLALSMQVFGFSAAASWSLVLAPVVLVGAAIAGVAYLIYSNWGGISSFFSGIWESVAPAFEVVKPVFDWFGEKLSAIKGWFSDLLGPIGASSSGFQDWSNAGRLAGAQIATNLQSVMTAVYDTIDVFRKLGAIWDFVTGKGYNFTPVERPDKKDYFAIAREKNEKNDFKNLSSQTANWPISGGVAAAAKAAGVAPTAPTVAPVAAAFNVVNGAAGATGKNGAAAASFASVNTPVAFAPPSFTIPPIPPSKVDIGGRLDIRITSDGKANVERVESNNKNYAIDTRAGGMYAAGA
jgi:hypothetical protein